jgi:hypothetical protein
MDNFLRISGKHYKVIHGHFFPGDGLESIAFALCGRHRSKNGDILTVSKVVTVPSDICKRTDTGITWPTEVLAKLLDEAHKKRLGVVKFHSHPSGYAKFSDDDNESDRETFSSISLWLDDGQPNGSAVMLPDGKIFGRLINNDKWEPFSAITVTGDNIFYWYPTSTIDDSDSAFETHKQLFGTGTLEILSKLSVGIVGCSGTGSIVLELLARLGIHAFVLVDHDRVEERNLNRIVNSKRTDIGKYKVEVLAKAIQSIGFGTDILPLALNIFDPKAANAITECDVVFGCMDTAEGRHLLNRIATFYLIPYFDLGVHLAADGFGGISEASGVVHYLQPGESSLLSRKAYTIAQVQAENLRRTDPEAYKDQVKAGYIEGVDEKSPAVASINATIASLAVNEFLARIHPYRSCTASDCAVLRFNFMETIIMAEKEGGLCRVLAPHVGRGDVNPLLDMPALSN